jgi:hypothetical protein
VTHFDHSPAFWALLRGVYPAVDRADAFLAGVTWLGRRWERLPPIERSLLITTASCAEGAGDIEENDPL